MERAVISSQVFRFGLFEADPSNSTLTRNGVRVKIQDQPFRVLILLLQRPGEIITREELRQKLWPEGTYVDFDGSLNVILKKLRAAIDDDSDNPRFIETIPRRGYRFIAPVSQPEMPPTSTVAVAVEPEHLPGVEIKPVAEIGRPRLHFKYAILSIATLALIGVGSLVWRGKPQAAHAANSNPPAVPVPMRRSVAVLGFYNVSGKASDAWMATAFSEMLSTELAAGEKLRLVSGEDVANLRMSSPWSPTDTLDRKTTSRIGAELGGDLLVLGSYTVVGESGHSLLRLDVRMQQANTGEILTEIAELGGSTDLFNVISRIGEKLRGRLGLPAPEQSDEAGVVSSLPKDPDAARLYARGLAKMRDFDFLAAKDLLEQASKADPKFALVHLRLSESWSRLGYEQQRKEESKKALDLSANLPIAERLLVEGNYYTSLAETQRAASTYRALFQIFPDSVDYGLLLAGAQIADGHSSQAASTIAQLRTLPPPASDDPRIDLLDIRATAQDDPSRLVLIRNAIRKATAQGKRLLYAQARKEECLNLIYGDHPEQGPPACDDAYNIFLAAGNRLGAADAIRMMGDYEGSRGHREQAIATYERALKILNELGEHLKTGAVLNNMAINYVNEGKADRGEQLYRQAKFHFEQAGDKALTATAVGNIADILYVRGDLLGAEKMYRESLGIQESLDHGRPGYVLYRLADLDLARGRIQDAHRHAQQAVEAIRAEKGGFGYLAGAMIVFGEVLKSEGNLEGARQQFEQTLAMGQRLQEGELIGESQVELADLALDEKHPEQVEPLLKPAIAEFEKENGNPDATTAYTDLSRALLMEGKIDEARKAIQHASEISAKSTDPTLKIPVSIQTARVEMATASHGSPNAALANQELQSAIRTARKFGYYNLECEARLALGELEAKTTPAFGQTQLEALAAETRSRGFEFVARRAEQAASAGTAVAVNKPSR